MNILYQIDKSILLWLNSWIGWHDWIDWTIYFRVEILPYFFMAGLLLFVVLYKNNEQKIKKRVMIIEAFTAGFISRFLVTEVIRFFYNRPRPFEIVDGLHIIVQHPPEYSFPSGHTAFYFALAITVFLFYKKMGLIFIFIALQLTISRIMVGFHWPSDIVCGILIAASVSILIHYYFEHKIPPPAKEKFLNFLEKF